MMIDDHENFLIEEDYYTFLNIPKNASNEEINNAYRRLSLTYHPDKHTDLERKKWAENIFNKTKKAYEVLSDPHQRAIYDTLGTRGLETEGWEIVQRTKTPLEIREEYERLNREREERRLLRSTNPKGTTTVSINATDLFNQYHGDYEFEQGSGLPTIEVSSINTSHSVESPITLKDTVTLSCNMSTQNGTGTGSLNISSRRITSEKGWAEVDVGIGNGPMTSLKIFRTLTKRVFCTGVGALQFTSQGIRPSFASSLGFQLNGHSAGYLTYKTGTNSSMTTTLVQDAEFYHCNLAVQFGLPHSFVSATYTRKMLDGELKLRFAFKVGTFGGMAEYGAERKISQNSSLSGAVLLGVPTGVLLKIKLTRGSQTFVFPIHLCDELMMAPIFYGTLVPMVTWLTIKKLIIDPINSEKANREIELMREKNKSRIQEKKLEAMRAIDLMQEMYKRITADENKQKGLIIIKAVYGKLPKGSQSHDVEGEPEETDNPIVEFMDVTIPIQCLVKNSRLVLQSSSKSQLPGFYDLCIGEDKHLTIKYSHQDETQICTIKDDQHITLP